MPTLTFPAAVPAPAPVSPAVLHQAFYGVLHLVIGADDDFTLLRDVPKGVMEFCGAEEPGDAYALVGRVIGLVRILCSERGRRLSRVSGGPELERAIAVAAHLPLSPSLKFSEAPFWAAYGPPVAVGS